MAVLKFRVYWEEEDAIYRDILIQHTQNFEEFYKAILGAFQFDQIHAATFYRSNDTWQRGREISKEVYDKEYKAPPLLMHETTVASEIIDTNQHFIFVYDFVKQWTFLIELIQVIKNADANMDLAYPNVARVEGVAPLQYGTKGLLGEKFADIEEKYDLSEAEDGFGEEGEEEDDKEEDESNEDQNEDGFFDGEAF
jgi:hypothetical protein